MTETVDYRIVHTVTAALDLAGRGRLLALWEWADSCRFSYDQLVEGFAEYLIDLYPPPLKPELEWIIVKIRTTNEPTWSIRASFWEINGKRSDLAIDLEVSIINERCVVALNDIFVP